MKEANFKLITGESGMLAFTFAMEYSVAKEAQQEEKIARKYFDKYQDTRKELNECKYKYRNVPNWVVKLCNLIRIR